MRRVALLLALALVALLATPAEAGSPARSIKFPCKLAGTAQLDPIVVPDGGPSAHLHQFIGNLGVPSGVHTYDEAITQGTTCKFDGDTAAYWFPAMYDGADKVVGVKGTVYYDKMTSQAITAFPPDMGFIWGSVRGQFSSKPRSFYGWNCRNSDPLQPSFASVDCRSFSGGQSYVTFRAFSPYCWDGVDPGVRNFGDHVFYPNNFPSNQLCPAGAIVLPRLRVNANYLIAYNPNGHLSSDGPGQHGETAHTDFWNTWQQPKLEALVAQLNG